MDLEAPPHPWQNVHVLRVWFEAGTEGGGGIFRRQGLDGRSLDQIVLLLPGHEARGLAPWSYRHCCGVLLGHES